MSGHTKWTDVRDKLYAERPGMAERVAAERTRLEARITKIVVTCDLDDGEVKAAESVSFTYGGKTYTLHLCQKHLDEVKSTLEGLASAGQSRVRGHGRLRAVPQGRTPRAARPAATPRGLTQAELRDWARSQGYSVGDRGRIPGEVRAAYEASETIGGRQRH